jgi:calmodulin
MIQLSNERVEQILHEETKKTEPLPQLLRAIYTRYMNLYEDYIANMYDLTNEKIAEYKEAFDMIDKDKKGTISVNDITKIMKNFGYPISRKEVEKMVAEMDTSGSGELDFEEFVTLMQKQTQYIDESDEDQVLKAFKSFDKDHDGKITMYEFRYILSQLGDMFTEEECDTLFKECDLDNDGVLVYQDFINFWRNH